MFNRDCVCFPRALAKAAAHRGVSAAATEQCTYQSALFLASDDILYVDLGAWRRLIEEHHGSLELTADQSSFERECLVPLKNTGHAPTSCEPIPRAYARARHEAFYRLLYPGGDSTNGHRNQS